VLRWWQTGQVHASWGVRCGRRADRRTGSWCRAWAGQR